jgi:hypothetical protein
LTKDQQRVVAGWTRAPRTDWVAGAYFRELTFSNVNFRDGFREHASDRTAAGRIDFREHDDRRALDLLLVDQ